MRKKRQFIIEKQPKDWDGWCRISEHESLTGARQAVKRARAMDRYGSKFRICEIKKTVIE